MGKERNEATAKGQKAEQKTSKGKEKCNQRSVADPDPYKQLRIWVRNFVNVNKENYELHMYEQTEYWLNAEITALFLNLKFQVKVSKFQIMNCTCTSRLNSD